MLVVAGMLAACGVFGDDGPPDYALPGAVISPLQIRALFGVEGSAGSGAGTHTTTAKFALDDGRWAHAELLYVDHGLSEWVTPPSGADLRGTIQEVPIQDTDETFAFVERPPSVLDEVFGCVRLVVNTRDFMPLSEPAKSQFLENVETGLGHWLSELPEDPCDGRPGSPPDGVTSPPAGVGRSG